MATGRQSAGLGLHAVKEWMAVLRPVLGPPSRRRPVADAVADAPQAISMDLLQGLADVMRKRVLGYGDIEGEFRFYFRWVQDLRDEMLSSLLHSEVII